MASKSVNWIVPLESAVLVDNGSQFNRLVEASIRQVVFERVLNMSWKPLVTEIDNFGGVGGKMMTVKLLVAPSGGVLLSVTLTVIVFVLGAEGAVFVHVNTPLVGLIKTFAGAETIPNVNVQFGKMLLVAELVTTSVCPA